MLNLRHLVIRTKQINCFIIDLILRKFLWQQFNFFRLFLFYFFKLFIFILQFSNDLIFFITSRKVYCFFIGVYRTLWPLLRIITKAFSEVNTFLLFLRIKWVYNILLRLHMIFDWFISLLNPRQYLLRSLFFLIGLACFSGCL